MIQGMFDRKIIAAWIGGAVILVLTMVLSSCRSTDSSSSSETSIAPVRPPLTTSDAPVTTPEPESPTRQTTEPAPRQKGEPEIRVRLLIGVAGIEVASSGGDGGASVRFTPKANPSNGVVLPAPVTITRGDSGWTLLDATKKSTYLPRGAAHAVTDHLSVNAEGGRTLKLNGKDYPGRFVLLPTPKVSPGAFDAVEYVPADTYVIGVIAKELYPTWSLETFKAQAVAARSYALQQREIALARGDPYDVESSESDQAYGGSTTHANANRAVRETAGMVLTWNGRVLRAYYSSTCGGRASSARDTWPTTKGYEYNLAGPIQCSPRDDSCSQSPVFRWTVTRDRSELTRRIAWFGKQNNFAIRAMKKLTRVEVATTNEYGRPRTYKLYDDDGKWYSMNAEQLRIACNTSVPAGAETAPDPRRPATKAGGAPTKASERGNASVPLSSSPLPAIPTPTRDSRVSSGDATFEFSDDRVTIRGRGFGHGCGLCQYGAEGMARAGLGYMEILKRSYPGATIERAY
ncbi:MAG TPA: SpoIID/LytB domain-containing protein [Phycisphaerales bacterium]|nr:SpoIID/LytB domain-containing protein [Phycisphaerales bacterium]